MGLYLFVGTVIAFVLIAIVRVHIKPSLKKNVTDHLESGISESISTFHGIEENESNIGSNRTSEKTQQKKRVSHKQVKTNKKSHPYKKHNKTIKLNQANMGENKKSIINEINKPIIKKSLVQADESTEKNREADRRSDLQIKKPLIVDIKDPILLEQEESELFIQWIEQNQVGNKEKTDKKGVASSLGKAQPNQRSTQAKNTTTPKSVSFFIKEQGLKSSLLKCIVSMQKTETTIHLNIDFHGLTLADVKQIMSQLTRIRGKQEVHLHCIHGYTQGTVLRDYLRYEFKSPRLKERFNYTTNEGQTDLILTPMI